MQPDPEELLRWCRRLWMGLASARGALLPIHGEAERRLVFDATALPDPPDWMLGDCEGDLQEARAFWAEREAKLGRGVDGCEGPGHCHGPMSWCANCGDVGDVCDDPFCDAHAVDDTGDLDPVPEPPRPTNTADAVQVGLFSGKDEPPPPAGALTGYQLMDELRGMRPPEGHERREEWDDD